MNYSYVVSAVNETLLSEVVSENLFLRIIKSWKPEYGELVDFGGGTYDVTCEKILQLCDEKPAALRKKFPELSAKEAVSLVNSCISAVAQDS